MSRPAPESLAELHERVIKELRLTDQQDGPVRQILEKYRGEEAAWMAKNASELAFLQQQMKLAHRSEDPKAVAAAQVALVRSKQLQAEQKSRNASLIIQLQGILTKEQFGKAWDMLFPRRRAQGSTPPFHALGQLGLNEEQKGRIEKIMTQARAAASAPAVAATDPMQDAWDRIVKEVLTDQNRKQMDDMRRQAARRQMVLAILGNLKITDEQQKKVDRIWAEADRKAQVKGADLQVVYTDAQDRIVQDVLTPEQRKQLQDQRTPKGGFMPHGGAGAWQGGK
jgi:hypothetical protein